MVWFKIESMKNLNVILIISFMLAFSSCNCEPCNCLEDPAPLVLDLPESYENTDPENTIDVFITNDNKYLVFSEPIHRDSLAEKIIFYRKENSSETIQLFADKLASWETAIFVIDIAKETHMKLVLKTTDK